MARLQFDEHDLVIWSSAVPRYFGPNELRVSRRDTKALRLSTGFLAVRVSVIRLDGTELRPAFTVFKRGPVRQALQERGWPVVEDRGKYGRRS
jgi:hypothetical protein